MAHTWTASEMGKKGGRISRRVLTREQAQAMVRAREAKKAAHGVKLKKPLNGLNGKNGESELKTLKLNEF